MINPSLIQQVKARLEVYRQKIPVSLREIDRLKFIHEEIMCKLSNEDNRYLERFVRAILQAMRQQGASDIEMGGTGTQSHVWMRIESRKAPVPELGSYHPDDFNILIQALLQAHQREFLIDRRSFDFSYAFTPRGQKELRHRACAYFELGNLALNARAIDPKIRPYESYEFHANVTRTLSLVYTKEGLILVTGITGMGKSTTLDAIVDMNNATTDGHIVVIARPIEYIHESKKCIVRHREVGRDTRTFKNGTIESLRQDPDIIVIGEIRDPDTIMAALEAADSGHKVFSTLHTYSAVESIQRIIGEMPSIEQERIRNRLSDLLRCVISQRLVPSTGGSLTMCREIMLMTPAISAAIKNNNLSEIYQMIAEGSKLGMNTLEQDLLRLTRKKKITMETAMYNANNKTRMKQLLQRIM